jgi:RNA polymerase sigma factor (sigma-70 family)
MTSKMTPDWTSLLRLRMRHPPPNWSYADWREELKAHCAASSWQAASEYDPSRGVPLQAFVHRRVLADAYTRYRQECKFARRYGHELQPEAEPRGDETSPHPAESAALLSETLARLPEADRRLIRQLFCEGLTEAEVARAVGVSQPAVNRRKRLILRGLRQPPGEKKAARGL